MVRAPIEGLRPEGSYQPMSKVTLLPVYPACIENAVHNRPKRTCTRPENPLENLQWNRSAHSGNGSMNSSGLVSTQVWVPGDGSVSIEVTLLTLEQIRNRAVAGMNGFRHGGFEVGGVL